MEIYALPQRIHPNAEPRRAQHHHEQSVRFAQDVVTLQPNRPLQRVLPVRESDKNQPTDTRRNARIVNVFPKIRDPKKAAVHSPADPSLSRPLRAYLNAGRSQFPPGTFLDIRA